MSQSDLFPRSALLASKGEIDNKILYTGRIKKESLPDGFLFYILEIDSSQKRQALIVRENVEKSIRTIPHDLNTDNSVYFEKIITEVNDSFGLLPQKDINLWKNNFNAVVGLIDRDEIILSQSGKIGGYLFRKNKISSILDRNDEDQSHPLRTFTNITAGKLMLDDKLVLANNTFFNHLSLDRVRSVISNNSTEQTISQIYHNFHIHNTPVNAIFIEIISLSNIEGSSADCVDTIYVDQKIESSFTKAAKTTAVYLQKAWAAISLVGSKIMRHSKTAAHKTKAYSDRKVMPFLAKKAFEAKTSGKKMLKDHGISTSVEFKKMIPKNLQHLKIRNFNEITSSPKNKTTTSGLIAKTIFTSIYNLFAQREKRKYLYIGAAAILLIVVISSIKSKNKVVSAVKNQQDLVLNIDRANDLYNKGKQDFALGKPAGLTELNDALALAIKAEDLPSTKDKAKALVTNITSILDAQIKAKRVDSSAQSYTIGSDITKSVLLGAGIYGINSDGKLYEYDTRDNSSSLVASIGKDNGVAVALASSESLSSIYILTDKQKLIVFDAANKTQTVIAAPEGQTSWENADSLAVFSTNIYLLDPASNMIWKHSVDDDKFAKASKYFNDPKVNIKNGLDLSIDGNLYVLSSDSTIAKFSRNALSQEITPQNIPKPNDKITKPTRLVISEDSSKIYVLDQSQNRVVAMDKTGDFSEQYIFDGIAIDNFVINTKLQKIWGIAKGQVYEMGL